MAVQQRARPSENLTTAHRKISNPRSRLLLHILWAVGLGVCLAFSLYDTVFTYEFQLAIYRANTTLMAGLSEAVLSAQFLAVYGLVAQIIARLLFFGFGIVVFYYRPDDWLALLTSASAIFFITPAGGRFWVVLRTFSVLPVLNWLYALVFALAFILPLTLLFLIPDGRFSPRWTKWVVLLYIPWEVYHAYGLHLRQVSFGLEDNIWMVVLALAIGAQAYRYRHSSPIHQHQLKWFIYGSSLHFLTQIFFAVVMPGDTTSVVAEFLLASLWLSRVFFGVCIIITVARYRLYDINIIINRSVVYGSVSLVLVLFFLVLGFLLQAVLGEANANLSFILAVGAAGLLFNPLRRQVQHVFDRHLFGLRFDLNELNAAQNAPAFTNPGVFTGQMLGEYKIGNLLGKGGMGEVYQATRNGQLFAVKVLSRTLAPRDEFLKRFTREAETTLQLSDHPHIIETFGIEECDGVNYIVMAYIDGIDLKDYLKQHSPVSLCEVSQFLPGIASALDFAHAHGFVHRDIKPSNIMLCRSGGELQALLLDFGVAKIQDVQTQLTGSGAIGTIDYMAPEQITAAKDLDHRADIYALAIVVYELLVGERPFTGGAAPVLFAHLYQPAPNPRDVVPDLPEATANAILKALEKDPEKRFQSAGGFVAAAF